MTNPEEYQCDFNHELEIKELKKSLKWNKDILKEVQIVNKDLTDKINKLVDIINDRG